MKHSILLLIALTTQVITGQTHLNDIYPNTGGLPGPGISVSQSGYTVASSSLLNFATIDFAQFDFNGSLVAQKSYYLPSLGYGIVTCSKCLRENKGNIYWAQTNFQRQDSVYVQFWKLNSQLDSIYTKKHIVFETGEPDIKDLQFDTDSTFIVSGSLYRGIVGSDKYDLWVARFDTAFNVIWETRIIENTPNLHFGYRGEDLTIDAYGSVLISGRVYLLNAGTQTYVYKTSFARFDRKDGSLKWVKEFNQAPGSANMATLDEGDGTYRFAQMQYLSVIPRTTYPDSNQIRFGLIDTLGNVVWDKLIGPKLGQFWFRDLQRTADGNYYMAGENNLPFSGMSAGFKVSPAGDSLWFRSYLYQDTVDDDSHVWSFQQTPDSGFVHMGIYIDWDNDLDPVRRQYSWLLKTDKYGCAVKDCNTIGITEGQPLAYNAKVYPNPSAGSFVIEIPEGQLVKNLMAEVYNTSGKRVYQGLINDYKSRINLTNIAPGLYMLKITEGQSEVYKQKIIVR